MRAAIFAGYEALCRWLLGNTITYFAARSGRVWGCVLCRLLDRLDKGHCARSLAED